MTAYGLSDIGLVRKINEDSYEIAQLDNALLAVVCDGVGGENAGEVASSVACKEIVASVTSGYRDTMDLNSLKNLLINSVTRANVVLYELSKSDQNFHGMGSTVSIAFVKDGILHVVHAGDSRVYHISKGVATPVTKDHTIAQFLFDQGKIGDEEMKEYPQKNIITRALGSQADIELDYNEIYLSKGDIVTLCTDGLFRYVSDEEIARMSSLEGGEKSLVKLANERGGRDNITVVIITENGRVNNG